MKNTDAHRDAVLLMKSNTRRLDDSSQVLKKALETAHELEDSGREILENLDEQTEQLKKIKQNVSSGIL